MKANKPYSSIKIAQPVALAALKFQRSQFNLAEKFGKRSRHAKKVSPQNLADENEQQASDYVKEQKLLGQELARIDEVLNIDKAEMLKANHTNPQPDELFTRVKNYGFNMLTPGELAEKHMEKDVLQKKLKSTENLREQFEKKAHFWREYVNNPASQRSELFQQFFGNAEVFQRMVELTRFDEQAVNQLALMMNIILSQLDHLTGLGSTEAAKALAFTAIRATGKLNDHANQKRTTFRSIAKGVLEWPLLTSRKTRRTFPQRYGEKFLKDIHLAEKTAFENFNTSNFKTSDDAGAVAWRLWHYIGNLRQTVRYFQSDYKNERWFHFTDLELKVGRLKPFSKDSYGEWWNTAKEFLLESYPDPSKEPALVKIGRHKKPEKRSRVGKSVRSDEWERLFFEALRSKFKSFSSANRNH